MLQSTEQIIDHGLHQHLIRDQDLANLFKGSTARRYALVNKAIKKGELTRLSRGCYMVAEKYLNTPFSQFYLANRIVANSYISAESALSFHGWIPERITQTTSICAFGRKREYDTPVGVFSYLVPPIAPEHFYQGVRATSLQNKTVYIASPLRALIDYIYWHRVHGANKHWLSDSMRIEPVHIAMITEEEVSHLKAVYTTRYVQDFLEEVLDAK